MTPALHVYGQNVAMGICSLDRMRSDGETLRFQIATTLAGLG